MAKRSGAHPAGGPPDAPLGPAAGASERKGIATLRGRIGDAIDRVLVYATGGGAWTRISDNVVVNGFGTVFNAASTNAGWTICGGAEFAFAQNWTAKFEYLYVGTNVSQTGALPAAIGGSVTETAKIHDSLIRAGINFKSP